jgi:hypothetical protein
MSVWDIVIIILGVAQIIAVIAVIVAVLKVKNGPLMRFIPPILRIAKNGAKIGGIGVMSVAMLDERAQGLKKEVVGIVDGVQYGTNLDFGDKITYRGILGALTTARTARGMLFGGLAFLQRARRKAPPGPAAAQPRPRRSVADRLGLVPPIARPLGRIYGHAMTARNFYRELKKQGVL